MNTHPSTSTMLAPRDRVAWNSFSDLSRAMPAYLVDQHPLCLGHFLRPGKLGPVFHAVRKDADATAERLGVEVWLYYIRSKNPLRLPNDSNPPAWSTKSARWFREMLLLSHRDAIFWERGWGNRLLIPLTFDVVFHDKGCSIQVVGASPSVQKLNEPTVLVTPAKPGKVRRANRVRSTGKV